MERVELCSFLTLDKLYDLRSGTWDLLLVSKFPSFTQRIQIRLKLEVATLRCWGIYDYMLLPSVLNVVPIWGGELSLKCTSF